MIMNSLLEPSPEVSHHRKSQRTTSRNATLIETESETR